MGCIVTFSGDAAFLQRLIDGLLTEESVASKIPLYIDYHDSFLSTQVDETTGQRHDLQVPFTDTCRPQSLVYYDSLKTICPDPVHMTILCVEHDLRKMANKILKMKAPYGEEALRHLEMNLTERAVPAFPGATSTSSTRGDCAHFHARACSRPPEPMIRTFISGGSVACR